MHPVCQCYNLVFPGNSFQFCDQAWNPLVLGKGTKRPPRDLGMPGFAKRLRWCGDGWGLPGSTSWKSLFFWRSPWPLRSEMVHAVWTPKNAVKWNCSVAAMWKKKKIYIYRSWLFRDHKEARQVDFFCQAQANDNFSCSILVGAFGDPAQKRKKVISVTVLFVRDIRDVIYSILRWSHSGYECRQNGHEKSSGDGRSMSMMIWFSFHPFVIWTVLSRDFFPAWSGNIKGMTLT